MQIQIWSDLVCPWCYVGKRRFERALAAFPYRDEVQVFHRSFQLDPSRPRGDISSRRRHLMRKYGLSDDQVVALDRQMVGVAAGDGLEYRLTDASLTGNTLDAHQLVHLAATHGLQDAALERFYRAYFTEERSLFDRELLVALGGEAGLDTSEARRALEGDQFAAAVADDLTAARALGITGVPFFAIDGRYGVSGAQQAEVFGRVLARAWDERQA